MNSDLWVAEVQVARRSILERAPKLISLCQERWRGWISNDSVDDTSSRARVHLVSALSAFDDLDLSVGLTQLLSLPWVDANVILTLPTEAAARLFERRARAQSFDQLVVVVAASALETTLKRLPADALLCFIPSLSILTVDYLHALRDIIAGRCDSHCGASQAGVFRATSWRSTENAFDQVLQSGLAISLLSLCRSESPEAFEKSYIGMLNQFQEVARGAPPALPAVRPRPVTSFSDVTIESMLRLPVAAVADGGELIIRARGQVKEAPSQIFYRRDVSLIDNQSSLKLQPPLSCIGERPQRAEILVRTEAGIRSLPIALQVPPSKIEPWMLTCYLNRGGAGNPVVRAFADGIGSALRYAEDETGPRPGVPVVWGVLRGSDRVVAYAKQSGQYFFYIDHAYFGRGHGANYRITRNGYEAGPVRKCPPDRLATHNISLAPWRSGSSNILVCPPTEYFMTAHNCHDWLEKTLEALRRHTDRPIVVRRKPQPGEPQEPLADALQRAHALVTHSSNVAIEAVIAGTPVFVSPSSAAAPVGLTDLSKIESPVRPDREAWLAHLAYSQFSFEEIQSGAAWRMLLEWEEREFVSMAPA